ncbi:aromatic amino acid DMT transporter YddG [Zophobihabitans entericus]|uniref:Aromatic amino acid DMT transporter YddG n=1 Tax=Zophobihabitans entericus TaxID=1635327 RepID=A0A6G9IDD8_9GAMM|nr:aromatic amino acid DMT transporter YddG [Zophobihabitans entericus]QIQ22246.1 aromatic amino acid DMT transporter YddG [Zophobihabitans entericus]
MKANTATLYGILAIVLWSSLIALIRSVASNFGAITGAASIYSLGAILLLVVVGLPNLKKSSPTYLIVCGLMFAVYEICLALSIGFAHNHTQTIEVSMLNYLWPCLTVIFAIFMNNQRASLLIIPGSLLALFGIAWILSGNNFSLISIYNNLKTNPLSYGLAFSGAVIWALYCNITKRFSDQKNGVTLFFAITAACLWTMHFMSHKTIPQVGGFAYLELLMAAAAMACGYALWNVGITKGNMTLLATASYFTPVLSSAFATFWLGSSLNWQFWQGAGLVICGSLICWWSTRQPAQIKEVHKKS